jgi:hypothetical protein
MVGMVRSGAMAGFMDLVRIRRSRSTLAMHVVRLNSRRRGADPLGIRLTMGVKVLMFTHSRGGRRWWMMIGVIRLDTLSVVRIAFRRCHHGFS